MNILTTLIAITVVTSIVGFNNHKFFDSLKYDTYFITKRNQWYRMITSAFLHADWMHLLFNMMTLYFFAPYVMSNMGIGMFLAVYFAAILGGGLLTLAIYKNNLSYTAIGASGGVIGILFSAIALDPQIKIMIMFIPISISGWIFGLIYLAYSIYGMNKQLDNIGHTAHLGGAATGFLLTIILVPQTLQYNGLIIGIMTIPLLLLAYLVWKKR